VFSYANEYPGDLLYSDANLNSVNINPELTIPNKQWFKVYGIQIAEEDSPCKPDCNPLLYNVTVDT
jgi:hypothetical protein